MASSTIRSSVNSSSGKENLNEGETVSGTERLLSIYVCLCVTSFLILSLPTQAIASVDTSLSLTNFNLKLQFGANPVSPSF